MNTYDLTSGKVTVHLGTNFQTGVYKATFRRVDQPNAPWSNEISIRVNPMPGGKSAFHRFTNLRAGRIQTPNGWNVQDFAFHVVSPIQKDIDLTWKMIANDPNFVYKDGTVGGTWVRTYPSDAQGTLSINIDVPEALNGPIVPLDKNFTGTVELSACARGTSPCVPVSFYAYMLAQTPPAVNSDPDLAWFKSWDMWHDTIPGVWDADMSQFIVPYTNYWHNRPDWPGGWHSKLTVKNNSPTAGTYTIMHVPDAYSMRSASPSSCTPSPYTVQTKSISLAAGATTTVDLETLFGWDPSVTSWMEGYLLVTPPAHAKDSLSIITSDAVPNTAQASPCPGTSAFLTPGTFGTILLRAPAGGTAASGMVPLTARIAPDRGIAVTSVVFYLDGQPIGNGNVGSTLGYDSVLNWNSASVSNGAHQLSVKAFVGNNILPNLAGDAVTVATITVQNTPAASTLAVAASPTQITQGQSYTLTVTQNQARYSGGVDVESVVCSIASPTECTVPAVYAPWGGVVFTEANNGVVTVPTSNDIPPAIYKARIRPAGQPGVPWSNQFSITVQPAS